MVSTLESGTSEQGDRRLTVHKLWDRSKFCAKLLKIAEFLPKKMGRETLQEKPVLQVLPSKGDYGFLKKKEQRETMNLLKL